KPATNYPTAAKSLQLPRILRGGDGGLLHIAGAQGDLVLMVTGTAPGYAPAALKQGTLCIDPATMGAPIVLGVLGDPSGVLDVHFIMPALPPGIDVAFVVAQAAFTQGGSTTLGDGSLMLWLGR